MNVVALVDFHDNLRDVDRRRGEEFIVSQERYEEINAAGAASWFNGPFVEEVVREVPKETPESRAKKAPRRRGAAK